MRQSEEKVRKIYTFLTRAPRFHFFVFIFSSCFRAFFWLRTHERKIAKKPLPLLLLLSGSPFHSSTTVRSKLFYLGTGLWHKLSVLGFLIWIDFFRYTTERFPLCILMGQPRYKCFWHYCQPSGKFVTGFQRILTSFDKFAIGSPRVLATLWQILRGHWHCLGNTVSYLCQRDASTLWKFATEYCLPSGAVGRG